MKEAQPLENPVRRLIDQTELRGGEPHRTQVHHGGGARRGAGEEERSRRERESGRRASGKGRQGPQQQG